MAMKDPLVISDLAPPDGSRKKRKRIGRGPGSGTGKTSGKGEKGQRARAGFSQSPAFEGGQMPLVRRIPKRGFTSLFRVEYKPVNLGDINRRFEDGDTVEPGDLMAKGLIDGRKPVKVLARGEIKTKLTIRAHAFSKAAREAIEAAGGTAETLS